MRTIIIIIITTTGATIATGIDRMCSTVVRVPAATKVTTTTNKLRTSTTTNRIVTWGLPNS